MSVVINGTTGITTPTESVATTIGVGGATPSASGAGITFPATQSASTDANTLDDYEEGTFTPFYASGTSGGTASAAQGYYTKIGRMVYFSFNITMSGATGTSSGLTIGGLPFTSAASPQYGFAWFNYNDNFYPSNQLTFHITGGVTTVSLYKSDGAALAGNTAGVSINRGIQMNGIFQV